MNALQVWIAMIAVITLVFGALYVVEFVIVKIQKRAR